MVKPFFISITLIAFFVASCSEGNKNSTPSTQMQTSTESNAAADPAVTLPVFSVQDVTGRSVNLQDFKGKKLFVNLWASWCPPCRREMPSIEKLALSVDTNKVAFVLISLDDNFDKAKKFIKRQKLSLPIYYPAENLPELFNVQGIPATFIFNESGELMRRIEGSDDYNTDAYKALLK